MPITIYGIKNCDTMKKARAWLEKHGVDYAFHDERAPTSLRQIFRQAGRQSQAERLIFI
jgi:arsenate reductase-like glutaredoxin family protein